MAVVTSSFGALHGDFRKRAFASEERCILFASANTALVVFPLVGSTASSTLLTIHCSMWAGSPRVSVAMLYPETAAIGAARKGEHSELNIYVEDYKHILREGNYI